MSKVFRIVILLVFPFSVIAQNADSLKWKKFGVLYDQPFNKVLPQQIVSLSSSQELFTSKISNDFGTRHRYFPCCKTLGPLRV